MNDNKKSGYWRWVPEKSQTPTVPAPSIGCTCRVLHMVIPPEGMTIHCPVHGEVFVRGPHVTC